MEAVPVHTYECVRLVGTSCICKNVRLKETVVTVICIWTHCLRHYPAFDWICGDWQRRQWQPTPVLLPGKSHGRRSLVGCSPWGNQDSDTAELLHFHFSFACIGEGNGNPLQCSCLENPRGFWGSWGSLVGCHLWGRTESDRTEMT